MNTIQWSIIFAVVHALMELLILWIEAKVFETPFFEYFVICLNGRLGWVPKLNKFGATSTLNKDVNFEKI